MNLEELMRWVKDLCDQEFEFRPNELVAPSQEAATRLREQGWTGVIHVQGPIPYMKERH